MPDPGPRVVAVWIVQDLQDMAYVTLPNVITHVLAARLTTRSEEGIADLTETLESPVYTELQRISDEQQQNGIEPTFQLDGSRGSAYVRALSVEATALLGQVRLVSAMDFELLCARILSALGATARQVGQSGDGGVDFVATDLPISSHDTVALRACRPFVIGQAKRYREGNLITVHDLRSFVGAAALKADELRRQEERFGLYSPVAFAYWTTSDFNNLARDFSNRAGLWCLNGIALAQLMIRLGIPLQANPVAQPPAPPL